MIKKLLFATLLFISSEVMAQHVADTFQHAEAQGYSMQELDKQYPSAVGSGAVVFKEADEQRFILAYKTMLKDLAVYLNKNGFRWGDNTQVRIFNRVYFERDGSIKYYLVNLEPSGLEKIKQNAFLFLLGNFINNYKIKITASSKFAQCSPVIYEDATKS